MSTQSSISVANSARKYSHRFGPVLDICSVAIAILTEINTLPSCAYWALLDLFQDNLSRHPIGLSFHGPVTPTGLAEPPGVLLWLIDGAGIEFLVRLLLLTGI